MHRGHFKQKAILELVATPQRGGEQTIAFIPSESSSRRGGAGPALQGGPRKHWAWKSEQPLEPFLSPGGLDRVEPQMKVPRRVPSTTPLICSSLV